LFQLDVHAVAESVFAALEACLVEEGVEAMGKRVEE